MMGNSYLSTISFTPMTIFFLYEHIYLIEFIVLERKLVKTHIVEIKT